MFQPDYYQVGEIDPCSLTRTFDWTDIFQMGGYPSSGMVPAASNSNSQKSSRGSINNNNNNNDSPMFLSNPSSTTRASKSQSESTLFTIPNKRATSSGKEGSGTMTQSLSRLLNQPAILANTENYYEDDDKSDAFALDPDGMYSKTNNTTISSRSRQSSNNSNNSPLYHNSTSPYPSISYSSNSTSQTSLSSSPQQQQQFSNVSVSISLEGEILSGQHSLSTTSLRRKSRPAPIQTDSDTSPSGSRGMRPVIMDNPNYLQTGDDGGSLMVVPLMHSNSVRMKKKQTSPNEIDDILNTTSNPNGKNHLSNIPNSKSQISTGKEKVSRLGQTISNQIRISDEDEEEGIRQVHSFNSSSRNRSTSKKKSQKISQEMDDYIDSILKKKGKSADDLCNDTEGEINDFRETNLPILVGQEPVMYHPNPNDLGYLGRRRKSTVAYEQENPEQHAVELENVFRRTRSTINTKNIALPAAGEQQVEIPVPETSVQPVNNPMIVVSGGAKLLRKDKSLYAVGGVINEKKKIELEKRRRKTINRSKVVGKIGPLITVDSDSESEEEDRPDDTSTQYDLQTEYCEGEEY